MSFNKGDSGFKRLARLAAVFHHHLGIVFALQCQVFVHLHVGRRPQNKADDKSDTHLSHNFILTFQPLFVVAEYLNEVVHAAQKAQPHGGYHHQYEVNVAQPTQQQHGNEYGNDDDDAAHAGHANLLNAEGVDAGVALHLGYLLSFEVLDELLAEPCRYN